MIPIDLRPAEHRTKNNAKSEIDQRKRLVYKINSPLMRLQWKFSDRNKAPSLHPRGCAAICRIGNAPPDASHRLDWICETRESFTITGTVDPGEALNTTSWLALLNEDSTMDAQ